MNIFATIVSSIYNPKFYKKLREQSLGGALGYFFLLGLFLMTIFSLYCSISATGYIKSFLLSVSDKFPSQLQVSIHNGIVSTNAKEPYVIATPKEWEEEKKNILVIDTKTPFSQEKFDRYNSEVWLTKDSLFIAQSGDTQMKTINLSKVKDFTMNRSIISEWTHTIGSYMPWITIGIFLVVLIIFYIIFAFNLLAIFLVAFFIWLFSKKMTRPLSYKESYVVGIYAATAGLILNVILEITASNVHIPFTMTVLAVIIYLLNSKGEFKKSKKKK